MNPVMPQRSREVQVAAPEARRRTLLFLAVVTVTGLGLMIGVERWLVQVGENARHDPRQAMDDIAYVIRILGAVISLSLVGLALVLARVSWRVWTARRFPPPGMSLIHDVAVVEGPAAAVRAVGGFVAAALLGCFAVVFPYLLWRAIAFVLVGPPG